MTAQQQNAEMLELFSVYFVENDNPAYAWGQAASSILALPALRAFWPMSSVDYTVASRARDIAGGGYHLADNNTPLFGSGQSDALPNMVPFVEFDGVNQYLSRADGGAANWADITGTESYVQAAQRGLTVGGWFWVDALGDFERFIDKRDAGTNNRSFALLQSTIANAKPYLLVSTDGIAEVSNSAAVTNGILATATWHFIVGRFVPSTTLDLFFNGAKFTNAVGIPASIFDGAAPLTVGADAGGSSRLDGRASFCFLCAAAVSDSIITALYHQTRKLYNA